MASQKDVVRLKDEDYKSKSFKTAPSGRYTFTINKAQSKIVPGNESNVLRTVLTVSKGTHKGVNVFDNIAAHVGWKIAQLLLALGYTQKKLSKMKLTLPEVLKMIAGKSIDAVIKVRDSEDFGKQNKVVQYLPPGAKLEDDDDEEEGEEDDEEESEDSEDEDEDEEDEEDEDSDDEDEDDEDDDSEEEDEDDDEDEEDEEEDEDEEDDDEDEEEEDEDDDEDEPPTPRKKPVAKKAAPAKKGASKKSPPSKAKKGKR